MDNLKVGQVGQALMNKGNSAHMRKSEEFGKVIKGAIQKVNGLEQEADKSIMDLLNGKAEVHETMINLQKYDISMRLLLTIRNKAIEAYKEIIHMHF